MSGRPALALAAAVCALAGCAKPMDEERERISLAAGGERWQAIAATLGGPHDLDSPNVCTRGEKRCIDEVVREMRRRFEALAARCDHRAAFAFMYLQVTEGVATSGSEIFREPDYLNYLDAVFAELYFSAFDAHARGDRDRVPVAWQVAFDAAESKQVTGLGDLLLGMNAHISRDLPFALASIGFRTARGASGKRDYDRVNGLLADVQEPMLAEASERLDPSIAEFRIDAFGFTSHDIAALLATWRSEAFRNAQALAAARSPAERARVTLRIEANAEGRARVLQTATSYALLGETTEPRDRFCAQRSARG